MVKIPKNVGRVIAFLPLGLFAIAALLLVLPVVKELDPYSGKTAWVSAHGLTLQGLTGDEALHPESLIQFSRAMTIVGIIACLVPGRIALRFRIIVRILAAIIGATSLWYYISALPTRVDAYPISLSPWLWPCFFILLLCAAIHFFSWEREA